MFQLSKDEYTALRCHFGTLEKGKHAKYLPYAFTEQGVAMLSSVLNSKRAVEVNIIIMRAFIRLRHILSTHKELALKINLLEEKMRHHDNKIEKHDAEIQAIFGAIRKLMEPEEKPRKQMGFRP